MPRHLSVGYWQASRIQAIFGNAVEARRHAEVCLSYSIALEPFFLGYAHEALARAAHVAGDTDAAVKHLKLADEQAALVVREQDRKLSGQGPGRLEVAAMPALTLTSRSARTEDGQGAWLYCSICVPLTRGPRNRMRSRGSQRCCNRRIFATVRNLTSQMPETLTPNPAQPDGPVRDSLFAYVGTARWLARYVRAQWPLRKGEYLERSRYRQTLRRLNSEAL